MNIDRISTIGRPEAIPSQNPPVPKKELLGPSDLPLVIERLNHPFRLPSGKWISPREFYLKLFHRLNQLSIKAASVHLHGSKVPISAETFERMGGKRGVWNGEFGRGKIDFDDRVILSGDSLHASMIIRSLSPLLGGLQPSHVSDTMVIFSCGDFAEKWDLTVVLNTSKIPCIDLAPYVDVANYLTTNDPKDLVLGVAGGGCIEDWIQAKNEGYFVVRDVEGINFGWFLRLLCKVTEGLKPSKLEYFPRFWEVFQKSENPALKLVRSFGNHLPNTDAFREAFLFNLAALPETESFAEQLHHAFGCFLKKDIKQWVVEQKKVLFFEALRQDRLFRIDGTLYCSVEREGAYFAFTVPDLSCLDGEPINTMSPAVSRVLLTHELKALWDALPHPLLRLNLLEMMPPEMAKSYLPALVQALVPYFGTHFASIKARLSQINYKIKKAFDHMAGTSAASFAISLAKEGIVPLAWSIFEGQPEKKGEEIILLIEASALHVMELAHQNWEKYFNGIQSDPHLCHRGLKALTANVPLKDAWNLIYATAIRVPEVLTLQGQAFIETLFLELVAERGVLIHSFGKRLWSGERGREILELALAAVWPLCLEHDPLIPLKKQQIGEILDANGEEKWLNLFHENRVEYNFDALQRERYQRMLNGRDRRFAEIANFSGKKLAGSDCLAIALEICQRDPSAYEYFRPRLAVALPPLAPPVIQAQLRPKKRKKSTVFDSYMKRLTKEKNPNNKVAILAYIANAEEAANLTLDEKFKLCGTLNEDLLKLDDLKTLDSMVSFTKLCGANVAFLQAAARATNLPFACEVFRIVAPHCTPCENTERAATDLLYNVSRCNLSEVKRKFAWEFLTGDQNPKWESEPLDERLKKGWMHKVYRQDSHLYLAANYILVRMFLSSALEVVGRSRERSQLHLHAASALFLKHPLKVWFLTKLSLYWGFKVALQNYRKEFLAPFDPVVELEVIRKLEREGCDPTRLIIGMLSLAMLLLVISFKLNSFAKSIRDAKPPE